MELSITCFQTELHSQKEHTVHYKIPKFDIEVPSPSRFEFGNVCKMEIEPRSKR